MKKKWNFITNDTNMLTAPYRVLHIVSQNNRLLTAYLSAYSNYLRKHERRRATQIITRT